MVGNRHYDYSWCTSGSSSNRLVYFICFNKYAIYAS